jgi:mono/diheme cytochrome c family protein
MRSLLVIASLGSVSTLGAPAIAGDGAALFSQNCELCHQAGARGLAGQFPRLAGRVSAISRRPEGRIYLADVLTYGLSGTVNVDGQQIVGLMPPFAVLPDDVVADVLNYVQGLGDATKGGLAQPFTEQEIGAARALPGKTMDDVQSERRTLQRLKIVD